MFNSLLPKGPAKPSPAVAPVVYSRAAGVGEAAISLLPIPAALMRLVEGRIEFVATNQRFNMTGFGPSSPTSPIIGELGGAIRTFLAGDKLNHDFAWSWGDAVDRRHYRVTLARLKLRSGGRFLLTLVDQTAERRTEHNLRREMMTDSLTGLPNRAGFSDLLETTFSASIVDPLRYAVLVVDLDRFSRVNACLGALAGDELLITVARRLKGALRARDVLARTGGDEFGILLTLDDGPSDADHVARRIENALSAPFRLTDFEIRVSCSIGVAFGSAEIKESEDLIRHAQFAVKRAKSSGTVQAYQSQAHDQARHQFGLETALRRAIEGNKLRLALQPIWDLTTGDIVKFEALSRWQDDDGVEVPPEDFITVAEESGLIVPLGRWALNEAVQTMAAWDARLGGDCGMNFTVNLSAIQLQRDDIATQLEQALAHHNVPGARFTMELTESVLVSDGNKIARTMHAFKALGTTLAMDDFGTGYSNLAYLQKLPIDILKIDRSFVMGMLTDRDKLAIVRAILSLAQALNMKTCAEGIETTELSQTLAALGCTFGQGYLYAPPLEVEAAYQLLLDRRA